MMNWTKLSAMSEILSSAAILITLIYLAIQTQQNADATMANTRQEILAAEQQLLMSFVNDPELEAIRYKPELSHDEKVRLGFLYITFIRMRENYWLQYQNNVLDEESWETYRSSLVAMLGSPRGRTWWQNYAVKQGAFNSQFTSEVSEILASVPMQGRSRIAAAFD